MIVGSIEKPVLARYRIYPEGLEPTGAGSWNTGLMGVEFKDWVKPSKSKALPSRDQIFPMAYLSEQDANSSLPSHFHVADQFTFFVGGDGHLGPLPLSTGTLQFVGPYSPYGPLNTGPHGLDFITLRNRFDPGRRVMPDSRKELPPPPRNYRQVLGGPVHPLASADLLALKEPARTEVIVMEADGLGAWHYRVPPGQKIVGPDPASGDGQHWVVLAGHLNCSGDLAGKNSCVFISPDEAEFSARAGSQGLEILALQYPHRFKH